MGLRGQVSGFGVQKGLWSLFGGSGCQAGLGCRELKYRF